MAEACGLSIDAIFSCRSRSPSNTTKLGRRRHPSWWTMKNCYPCCRKAIQYFLPILAVCLQASLVEGSYFAASYAITDTNRLSTPFATTTAFLLPSKRTHTREARSTARIFHISKFVRHSYTNNDNSPQITNRRHSSHPQQHNFRNYFSSTTKTKTTTTTLFSNENAINDGDNENKEEALYDECSLQELYQQVQMEDSEWYYQTFSKLFDTVFLGDDPLDVTLCEKSGTSNVNGNGTEYNLDLKKDILDNMQNKDSIVDELDGKAQHSTSDNDVMDNETEEKKIDSKDVEVESPPPPDDRVTLKPVAINRSNMQEVEKWKGRTLRDGMQGEEGEEVEEGEHEADEAEEEVEDVNEEKPFREEDEEDDTLSLRDRVPEYEREDEQPVNDRNLSRQRERRNADNRQTKSYNPRPPLLVCLRNTYTGEVVRLCNISTLSNAGFSQKEVLVLRPKVLELIIEDGISRPKKGLPKRWVRLSKLEGYDGKSEEEEDDEDFDWEVEVIAKKYLDKKTGLDTPVEEDSEGGIHEMTKKSYQVSQGEERISEKRGTASGDDGDDIEMSKSIPPKSGNTSKPSKQYPDSLKKSQVSDERGPFISSRLPDETGNDGNDDEGVVNDKTTIESANPKQKRRAVRDEEDTNRSYDGDQLPPRRKERTNGDLEEIDDINQRRPPQSRRRKRVDDLDSRSKTPSRRSSAYQQRRQRERPMDRRRELVIDRGDDDVPPPNKFWMDLPTFRDYLRTEAQLRLKILGPDWKESVLDESRWRYDLYKTWLTMLGEGVGENQLYEYRDRPRRPEKRRRRSPPPPSRSRGEIETGRSQQQMRQQKIDFEEDEYEYGNGEEISLTRRSRNPQEQIYRSREERTDRRPRPQSLRGGTWRNFSDLEESLQSSSQERSRSVRRVSREEEEDVDDDEYFDDVADGSRSSRATSGARARREFIEPRNELPYENYRTSRKRNSARSGQEDGYDET